MYSDVWWNQGLQKKNYAVCQIRNAAMWIEIRLKDQTLGKEGQYQIMNSGTDHMMFFSDSIFRESWDSPW